MSLLTATVAALLLAAPAATAGAQTLSFSATEVTVKEGGTHNAADVVRVTVTKTGDVGTVQFVTTPTISSNFLFALAPGAWVASDGIRTWGRLTGLAREPTIDFRGKNQAELRFYQRADGASNWHNEGFVMALRAAAGTRIGPNLKVTASDTETPPTATFSKTSIKLTEGSVADGRIRFEYPAGATRASPDSTFVFNETGGMGRSRLRIKVDPPDGIGTGVGASFKPGPVEFKTEGQGIGNGDNQIKPVDGMAGMFTLPVTVSDAGQTNGAPFEVTARPDQADFRNPKVTISWVAFDTVRTSGAQRGRPGGPIKAGPPLVVEVISDEAVPTVYFSPTDINIKEGGRTTAALVSEGKQGAEVNTVKLAVDGNAMVDLYRGSAKLEPKDGMITVDLKDTNLARLTARSMSDRSLLDGQMKKKTWRIADADGANIDTNANWFTVTVEGSTAVPALPLLAQLLLALFLTAGGARLYRRR